MKKNRLKFWKNRPVWFGFGFLSLEPENRTEPNPNRKKPEKKPSQTETKPSQTEKTEPNQKNRAKPEKTELNRFEPVSVFFKKNSIWLLFLIKTEPNQTVNTPSRNVTLNEGL